MINRRVMNLKMNVVLVHIKPPVRTESVGILGLTTQILGIGDRTIIPIPLEIFLHFQTPFGVFNSSDSL